MKSRLLAGLLPTALLEQYRFWQDPEDNLRGYPVDERDTDPQSIVRVTLTKVAQWDCTGIARALFS